jgi:hypothetical protein
MRSNPCTNLDSSTEHFIGDNRFSFVDLYGFWTVGPHTILASDSNSSTCSPTTLLHPNIYVRYDMKFFGMSEGSPGKDLSTRRIVFGLSTDWGTGTRVHRQ